MSRHEKNHDWVVFIPLLLGVITFAASTAWFQQNFSPEKGRTTLSIPTAAAWWLIWHLLFVSSAPKSFFDGERGRKILEILSATSIVQARIHSVLAAVLVGGILAAWMAYQLR